MRKAKPSPRFRLRMEKVKHHHGQRFHAKAKKVAKMPPITVYVAGSIPPRHKPWDPP